MSRLVFLTGSDPRYPMANSPNLNARIQYGAGEGDRELNPSMMPSLTKKQKNPCLSCCIIQHVFQVRGC